MDILSMAWRNIWRNRRRTLATVAATTLAVFVMISYSGLVEGVLRVMEGQVLDMEIGDVQIHAPEYRDKPSIYLRIDHPDAILAKLDASGLRAAPRLLGGGLAAAGDTSAGVILRGLDPVRETTVTRMHEAMHLGSWIDESDPYGVVIGWRLARTLELELGGELLLLSQAADGSMANELYTVRGILKGVGDAIDRSTVIMTASAYRELMVVPEGVHEIVVRRAGEMPLETAAALTKEAAPGQDVLTWRELMPTIASYLDSARSTVFVFFFVIYIAIGMVILNAMLMAVFERIREFGILKALGMKPSSVLGLILTESAIIAGLAVFIGTILSLPALWALVTWGIPMGDAGGMTMMGISMQQVWYAHVNANTFIGPIIALFIVVIVAVLYPALKAAAIKPVSAMRHQ